MKDLTFKLPTLILLVAVLLFVFSLVTANEETYKTKCVELCSITYPEYTVDACNQVCNRIHESTKMHSKNVYLPIDISIKK